MGHINNKIKNNSDYKSCDQLLLGDFNINLLNYNNNPMVKLYVETLASLGHLPLITIPTRITPTNSSLIDHITINSRANYITSGVITSEISDHLTPFVVFDSISDIFENNEITMKKRINKKENTESFRRS